MTTNGAIEPATRTDMIEDLYSKDLKVRERASCLYRMFSAQPAESLADWREVLEGRDPSHGAEWPEEIRPLVVPEAWPQHAFGTANAACLLLWHRPGDAGPNAHPPAGSYIGPHTPILGGVGHAHNLLWPKRHPSPSWHNVCKFLPQALDALRNPWSQITIACLNPEPGRTGNTDRRANRQAVAAGGRLDSIVAVCRPLAILACGIPVQEAIRYWSNPTGSRIIRVNHPLKWNGHGGVYDGQKVVEELRAALAGESSSA